MDQCGIQCIEADLMDRHTMHEPLDMVDVVYNLASPPPGAKEEEYSKFNDVALNNLLEEANEHGTKTFVHLSCLDIYGAGGNIRPTTIPTPKDNYQRAKLEGENKVIAFGRKNPDMKVRVVRAARAVGPRDTAITVPILRMAERGRVTLPSGSSSVISLSHPKDIAQSLFRAATYTGADEVFLIKSFDLSLYAYSRAVIAATGQRAEVRPAGMLSKSALSPYYAEQVKAGIGLDAQDSWNSISYTPSYTVQKTAEEVSEWYRKEPWVTKDLS
jgi:nucleoside-diphosphate-sugar epimerase